MDDIHLQSGRPVLFVHCTPLPDVGSSTTTHESVRVDTITTSATLIMVEPCVAIISICLPTIHPVLRDLIAWSTIEYLKMLYRIKRVIQGDLLETPKTDDVERAEVEPMSSRSASREFSPKRRHQQECSEDVIETSSDYELGDEYVFPDKPVVIKGQVMYV